MSHSLTFTIQPRERNPPLISCTLPCLYGALPGTYSRRRRAFFWPLKNSETTRRDATCVPSRLTGSRLLHSGKCAVGCLVSKASCGFYEAHPEMYYGSADLRNFELFSSGDLCSRFYLDTSLQQVFDVGVLASRILRQPVAAVGVAVPWLWPTT